MASIEVYGKDSTSFSVRLTGLQTAAEGANYTRLCYWTVYENPNSDGTGGTLVNAGYAEIKPLASSSDRTGGDCDFSDMTPNTTYRVVCVVYNADTNAEIARLNTSNFKTDTAPWSLVSDTKTSISSVVDFNITPVKAYTLYRYAVSFTSSGTAKVYTKGSHDTLGFFTSYSDPDLVNGSPKWFSNDPYISDDDSKDGSNFIFTANVVAGEIYYVWIRSSYDGESGNTTVYLEAPSGGGGDPDEPDEPDIPDDDGPLPAPDGTVFTRTGGASLTKKDSVNISLSSYEIEIATITFENSGIATFYTTDATLDVYGYLTLESTYGYDNKTGRPYNRLTEADGYEDDIGLESDGSDWDFSFSYPVEAGVTYYIGVRAFNGADSGTVTLRVIRPSAIPKWNWGASNGSASVVQTMAAANAVRNKESTKNFSHLVWNDMVDKVKVICDKAVGWWDSASYGLSYESTKAIANSDGEFVLTADMFNTLRNNLEIAGIKLGVGDIPETTDHDNAPSGTIPQPVNSGDKVFGHYFLTLTDYMNSCIDKL